MQSQKSADAGTQPAHPFPFMGLQRQFLIFSVLAKVGAHRGRGVGESILIPEIKYESRATNPFPLYGGRLGWGVARKRGYGAYSEFRRKYPCKPLRGKGRDGRAARRRGFAGERFDLLQISRIN